MKGLLASLTLALLAASTGGVAASADAAPAPVGLVTIKRATTTSLTLKWPAVDGADRYTVERGTDLFMTDRQLVRTVGEHRVTVDGLEPGTLYCFQVRAVDGSGQSDRSQRACQYTIGRQGTDTGPTYRIVTYNLCANACSGWTSRRADAADLVQRQSPDVVGLQEAPADSGMAERIDGLTQVVAGGGVALLARSARFTVANRDGDRRAGQVSLGIDPSVDKPRYAVWAELVDQDHGGRHLLFVNTHLSNDTGDDRDRLRAREATNLSEAVARINTNDLPVVLMGDMNSNQGRDYDAPGEVYSGMGLANSFLRAQHWARPNYNSATKGIATPTIGNPWGYHIDQVWADPRITAVRDWRNAARLVDGLYPMPFVSNHSPVMVELSID